MADSPLWLVAIGIPALLAFALAVGALLLCRYDQRHDRDTDLDVTLGQRNLRYRSRRPEAPAATRAAGDENVHPLPASRTLADAQNHPAQPAILIAERRAAIRRQAIAAENRERREAA